MQKMWMEGSTPEHGCFFHSYCRRTTGGVYLATSTAPIRRTTVDIYPIMHCVDGYNTRKSWLELGSNATKEDPTFLKESTKLLRAASLPNVAGRGNQSAALSSITISTRNVTKSHSSSYECVSCPGQPLSSASSHPHRILQEQKTHLSLPVDASPLSSTGPSQTESDD
ncbi:unnamed protein product [Boreogadus saida]